MPKLTKEQVLSINDMRKAGLKSQDIAAKLGVKVRTIYYWVKRMREDGIKVAPPAIRGSLPMKLT